MFTVVHKRASDEVALAEFLPLDLRWGNSLGAPGYITYGIPIKNVASHASKLSITKPYVTDFLLYLDGVGSPTLMGGFITEISIEDWEESKILRVAGKEWYHYFERIVWPKDPNSSYRTTTAADPTNGTVFDYTGTMDYLIYRLTTESLSLANSLVISGLNNPGSGGGTYRYRIEPGDTLSIAEHFSNIFSLGDENSTPYIRMNPLTRFFQTNPLPRYGASSPSLYKFTAGGSAFSEVGGGNCKIVSFKHGGIRGTRMFGIATGPSSKKAAFATQNDATYRRWDIVEEFTKSNAYQNLSSLVTSSITEAQIADVEVEIAYYNTSTDFFFPRINEVVFPGARVTLEADLGWINIADTFTVVSVDCVVDSEGTTEYKAVLNQPTSFTS